MILTKEQLQEFEEAAKPLIKFLNDDLFHPHVAVFVTYARAELYEGISTIRIEEYLQD